MATAALMYHDVTDDPTDSGFQRPGALPYKLTAAAFEAQLDRIAAGPLSPARVTELDLTRLGCRLLLTFDDGGKSALGAAAALSRRGWWGHFFIVTARIGERTFLSPADIHALQRDGHLIGSHSHTHPDICRDLDRDSLLREWYTSKVILQDILGDRCTTASVPGGDLSPAVIETAAEAGFEYLFTSEPTFTPRRVAGCWTLGRFAVKTATSLALIDALVHLKGWRRLWLARQVKEVARRGLGPVYRAYVRHSTRSQPNPEPPG